MDTLNKVEHKVNESLPQAYSEVISLARTVSQLEELTENQINKQFNISSIDVLTEQKNEIQDRLDSVKDKYSISISNSRLARFDEKSSKIVVGHRANPERKKFAEENIPNEGRGFFIVFSDNKNKYTILCFDFDNPKDKKFIKRNKSELIKAMQQESSNRYPDTKIFITTATESL